MNTFYLRSPGDRISKAQITSAVDEMSYLQLVHAKVARITWME